MKIISYMDFLLEGRRADAIQSLTAKYNGNKEQALQDITHVEQQMMQMFNNQGLVNKYIYSVMNFIESSDNTGHSHEDSIQNVLNDLKRLIDWEPRMKQQGKQLLVDQLDKMSWFQFNAYLNDFYDAQPHDKWKSKYTKEIKIDDITNTANEYEVVHIPNWNTAKRYMGDKLTWCVTQSENAFLNYTSKKEIFVFAFKPNYDELGVYAYDKGKYNAHYNSLDEFATSALAIRLHRDRDITVTCRYNHEHGHNDNIYGNNTVDILKKLNIYDKLTNILNEINKEYIKNMKLISDKLDKGINDDVAMEIYDTGYELNFENTLRLLSSKNISGTVIGKFIGYNRFDMDASIKYVIMNKLSPESLEKTGLEFYIRKLFKYADDILNLPFTVITRTFDPLEIAALIDCATVYHKNVEKLYNINRGDMSNYFFRYIGRIANFDLYNKYKDSMQLKNMYLYQFTSSAIHNLDFITNILSNESEHVSEKICREILFAIKTKGNDIVINNACELLNLCLKYVYIKAPTLEEYNDLPEFPEQNIYEEIAESYGYNPRIISIIKDCITYVDLHAADDHNKLELAKKYSDKIDWNEYFNRYYSQTNNEPLYKEYSIYKDCISASQLNNKYKQTLLYKS